MSRSDFVSFQERSEHRFDDVMNALKSILSYIYGLENHPYSGISRKSGDRKFFGDNPYSGRNMEHINISTSTNSRERYGDDENPDVHMKLDLSSYNDAWKIEEFLD